MIYAIAIPRTHLAGIDSQIWVGTVEMFRAELSYLSGLWTHPGHPTIVQGGMRRDGSRCIRHRVLAQAEGGGADVLAFRQRFAYLRAAQSMPGVFVDVPPIRSALALPPWEGWTGDDAAALNVVRPRVDQDRPAPVKQGLAGRVRRGR